MMLPAAAGGALAWWAHSPQFLLFALLSPVMMLSGTLGDRLNLRRASRRDAAAHDVARQSALRELDRALAREQLQRRAASPDAAQLLQWALVPGVRLWERRSIDDDMLAVRVGVADADSTTTIRTGPTSRSAAVLERVPFAISLRHSAIGVIGPRQIGRGLASLIVGSVAVLHPPGEVSMTFLLSSDRQADWHWARWLPHLSNPPACTANQRSAAVRELLSVLARRSRASRSGQTWSGTWHVLVIDDAAALGDLAGLEEILSRGHEVGIAAICVVDHESVVPSGCGARIRVFGETGTRAQVHLPDGTCHTVAIDSVSPQWSDQVARAMAHLTGVRDGTVDRSTPTTNRLPDILQLPQCSAADVLARWAWRDDGAHTVLGMGPQGPLAIDIAADGPHALVAGTTGSGKSELLQAWILGLAARHPPDDVNFLLVDYKGGAAFADCARLPHTTGLVTDLDSFLTARALRALESELRRRERAFADVGAADLAAFRKLTDTRMARLVIMVDEFASLAAELPNFIQGLVSIAQRGRSLGIHLILATQRPGSCVSADIRANTAIRVCLRVTDAGESIDVIDTADAAEISSSAPGSGYVRLGGKITAFRCAHAGYRGAVGTGTEVTVLGAWRTEPATPGPGTWPSDLERLATAIIEAGQLGNCAPADALWTEPLPLTLPAQLLERGSNAIVPFGLVDLPDAQRRQTMSFDLTSGGSMQIVGAPRSGRTTCLVTMAMQAARTLPPSRISIYSIDPSGALHAQLRALTQCATALGPADTGSALTLLRCLLELCNPARRDPSQLPEPTSGQLLLIDNWETLVEALPDVDAAECAQLLLALQRIGPSSALTVVVTGDRTTLTPRFSAAFDERLVLRLAERNDYSLAGIRMAELPTTMPPGRAIRGSDGAHVQFAHVTGDAVIPTADPSCTPEDASWPDDDVRHAKSARLPAQVRLRPLPAVVDLADLPRANGIVTLGVGGLQAEPIQVDLRCGTQHLVIAGAPRSGRSTALRCVLSQVANGDASVVVAAPGRSPTHTHARSLGLRTLDPQARGSDVGEPPAGPTYLIVDDCEAFNDTPAAGVLADWLRCVNVHAVVAGRADDLVTSFRGLGSIARRSHCGLLLRPGPMDGEILGVRLPRRPGTGPPGRGVIVGDPNWGSLFEGPEPVPVQVAQP